MDKGVRGIQNVNLLRWAHYYGIRVHWNILWGFPDERAEDYEQQARLIPNIVHLEPPIQGLRLALYRFSPLYFDRARFGIRWLKPEASLTYVYPSSFEIEKIAYYFEHEFESQLPDGTFEPLKEAIDVWRDSWKQPERPWFQYRWSPGLLHIEDGRNPANPCLYSFEAPLAEIYVAMSDRPMSVELICNAVDLSLSIEEITEVLDLFVLKGLAVRDGDLFLALAIPAQ